MDSSRTRFLLRALRPNGADDADPTFHDALQQTHADPELGAWFARERSVDRALAAKLREVRTPSDLKAHILQGVALSRAPQTRRRPMAVFVAALAAAASIALVIYTLAPRSRPSLVAFQTIVAAAITDAAQSPPPGFVSASPAEVRTWLQEQEAPVPRELPGRLLDLPTQGAAVTEWQGVRCSRIAFRVPEFAASGSNASDVVQLYAVPRRSCSSEGVGPDPRIETRTDVTVALWRDASSYYVLVAHAPATAVQALLGPTAAVVRSADEQQRPVTVASLQPLLLPDARKAEWRSHPATLITDGRSSPDGSAML